MQSPVKMSIRLTKVITLNEKPICTHLNYLGFYPACESAR